ncbi:hypothetical protein LY76DRAFT_596313 [Colletotrichum caudatum]|nr:hypothetical protein LY76DRAFT_596313 [Colletotrichum caudatum]
MSRRPQPSPPLPRSQNLVEPSREGGEDQDGDTGGGGANRQSHRYRSAFRTALGHSVGRGGGLPKHPTGCGVARGSSDPRLLDSEPPSERPVSDARGPVGKDRVPWPSGDPCCRLDDRRGVFVFV